LPARSRPRARKQQLNRGQRSRRQEGEVRGGRSGRVSGQVQRTPMGVEGEDGARGSRGAKGCTCGTWGEEVEGREGERRREATRMPVRARGKSHGRFRVRSAVQRRRGARQVNGTMESVRERRGDECVCKCVSKVGLRSGETPTGWETRESQRHVPCSDRPGGARLRRCAGCGSARTCTTRHAWGGVLGGGQGGARWGTEGHARRGGVGLKVQQRSS